MQEIDHLGWSLAGGEQAEPGAGAIVEALLQECRYVGEELGAAIRRDGDRLELVAAYQAEHRQYAGEQLLHLPGDSTECGGTAATIGHGLHADASLGLEQLGGEVRPAAGAVGAVVERAGSRLGVSDELRQRVDWQRW